MRCYEFLQMVSLPFALLNWPSIISMTGLGTHLIQTRFEGFRLLELNCQCDESWASARSTGRLKYTYTPHFKYKACYAKSDRVSHGT